MSTCHEMFLVSAYRGHPWNDRVSSEWVDGVEGVESVTRHYEGQGFFVSESRDLTGVDDFSLVLT